MRVVYKETQRRLTLRMSEVGSSRTARVTVTRSGIGVTGRGVGTDQVRAILHLFERLRRGTTNGNAMTRLKIVAENADTIDELLVGYVE